MADNEEMNLLREIRNAIQKHQSYIEERDKWQMKATQDQIEEYQKAKANNKYSYAIWMGIMFALYLIAFAQFLR